MELQITLDRSRRLALSTQIGRGIRDAIFSQRLPAGTRLPPTRELAQRLQVARMVVVEAYEWLVADGYAETRPGSGTFIAARLVLPQQASPQLGEPARRTDLLPRQPALVDFRPGLPAVDLFPRLAWKNALSRALQQAETSQLGYGPVEGLPRLRRVIAQYVARARGLPVTPDRVIITVGTAQAVDLLLRTLAPIQHAAVEDPGSEPVYRLLHLEHIQVTPVAVDESGMQVERLPTGPQAPQLVYVTPSHQFPSGWAMSLKRRMELLARAEAQNAVILEDDYDSEFRFDRQPPIALAALDTLQRVVYIGTFSKTMFPGLRLGYCVLPEPLIPRLLDLKWFSDRCGPVIEQLALADWLENGFFERHVRKMRRVYALRRAALITSLQQHFGEQIQVQGVPAGMHILASVDLGLDESSLVRRAQQAGVKVYPAGPSYTGIQPALPGLILGFGHLSASAITGGVEALAKAWG